MNGIDTRNTASGEDRVKTNGQVFTPDSIVNEMLDNTDKELALSLAGTEDVSNISDDDYISYIVLEPTAGNGNFLVRELERKLLRVENILSSCNETSKVWEIALLKAVSSIHAIELSADNVMTTKLRMLEVITTGSTPIFELEYKEPQSFKTKGFNLSDDMLKSIKYIIDRNIQCGDSLKCEKYLINKSESITDEWTLALDRSKFFDSLFKADYSSPYSLALTQYDFDLETGKVALRERTYKNMHSTTEVYQNTTNYVDYNKVYTLVPVNIYTETDDEVEDFDF